MDINQYIKFQNQMSETLQRQKRLTKPIQDQYKLMEKRMKPTMEAIDSQRKTVQPFIEIQENLSNLIPDFSHLYFSSDSLDTSFKNADELSNAIDEIDEKLRCLSEEKELSDEEEKQLELASQELIKISSPFLLDNEFSSKEESISFWEELTSANELKKELASFLRITLFELIVLAIAKAIPPEIIGQILQHIHNTFFNK